MLSSRTERKKHVCLDTVLERPFRAPTEQKKGELCIVCLFRVGYNLEIHPTHIVRSEPVW
jgi:hypothetical protein